ncbi:MAG TPA: DHH family phosphoesterase [bacterium]
MTDTRKSSILKFLADRGSSLSPLLILAHNYPDPDAIASAWALAHLAERVSGIRCRLGYGGMIGRIENQMMVKLLRIPIQPVKPDTLERTKHVALVDSQPPFENNPFSSRRRATIVIDHHPRHSRTKADLVMIDETAGATTSLLVEALLESGLELPARLSTAMVYGIGSETQRLGREAGPRDVAAYRACFPKANMRALSKIENPPRPGSFFQTLGKAIQRAFTARDVIGVHLGPLPSQEIVAQIADFLMTHEKMRWSVVTGRYDGKMIVSLRTRNPRAKAGRLLRRLLGGGTSAGGHGMIAGGSVLIGSEASEDTWQAAEESFLRDFLHSQGCKDPIDVQDPF